MPKSPIGSTWNDFDGKGFTQNQLFLQQTFASSSNATETANAIGWGAMPHEEIADNTSVNWGVSAHNDDVRWTLDWAFTYT
jgi:hypothetical protein